MQLSAVLFGLLLYAAVSLHAWTTLAWPVGQKTIAILYGPGVFAALTLMAPVYVPALRRPLKRYVWLSFAAGFGQSVISVLTGLGILAIAALLIWLQVRGASSGGQQPAGIFSAFGAGIGVLGAQYLLSLRLQREPEIRKIIELPPS